MKLFSRKALVAAAITAAVSLSGVTVANADTPDTGSSIVNALSSTGSQNNDNPPANGGSSISDMTAPEIRDWIAVFTAIISALSTVIAFYNKNFAK